MDIHCSRNSFHEILTSCMAISLRQPDHCQVVLVARQGPPGSPGRLDVLLDHASPGSGIIASLPAQVERAGQVTVSLPWLSRSLHRFCAGPLHLSCVEVPPGPALGDPSLPFQAFSGPALQIDGSFFSHPGRRPSRQLTRLRLVLDRQRESPEIPDLAHWQASGFPLGQVTPTRFRQALEPCLLLARAGTRTTRRTSEENPHTQILFRFDRAGELTCTATTPWEVVSQRLPLVTSASGDAPPCSHALFEEKRLRQVVRALHHWKTPLTLTLVPHGQEVVLLLSQAEAGPTLFCRGTTEHLLLIWEKIWERPMLGEALVPRPSLMQALHALSTSSKASKELVSRSLVLQVNHDVLSVQREEEGQEEETEQEGQKGLTLLCQIQIPLLNKTTEWSPVGVPLQSLKRMLPFLHHPVTRLERGQLARRATPTQPRPPAPIHVLRVSDGAEAEFRFLCMVNPMPVAETEQISQDSPVPVTV